MRSDSMKSAMCMSLAAWILAVAASAGAQCPPDTLLQTLNNPAPAVNDRFGVSVAVSGNTAVVGAYWDDPVGVTDAGTAYVFNATTGALVATLNNPAPTTSDEFGQSVAVSGNTAVVGAVLDNPGGVSYAGTVYVFDATTGALVATLSNPAPAGGDYFGYSVAVSGNTAVVGAWQDDPGGVSNAERAYVFTCADLVPAPTPASSPTATPTRSASPTRAPSQTPAPTQCPPNTVLATLDNPAPTVNDFFGGSVAVSGGVAVAGALGDNPGGELYFAGAAYIFDATTGALMTMLHSPAPARDEYFGASVAVSGNVIVVGALGHHAGPGLDYSGTAYVFDATTGALVTMLNNPAATAFDHFGNSVALSGNVAVVGAFSDDPGGLDYAGAAYVFDATTGAHMLTLDNPSPTAWDLFGYSVAVSSNVAVAGAPYDDPGGVTNAGTAYVFDAMTGALTATLNNPAPEADYQFGVSVAVSGDIAVVAAKGDSGGVNEPGTAYVFDATTGALLATLNSPEPIGHYAYAAPSVAVSGNIVVVGASEDDPGGVPRAGSAYVVTCADVVPTPTPDPTAAPSPTAPGVSPTASPTPVCCPGDADNSGGSVNANDFLAVQANFGVNHGVGGLGDADCSGGAVNANDFLAVQAAFGASCG